VYRTDVKQLARDEKKTDSIKRSTADALGPKVAMLREIQPACDNMG
jgi:hypothetical protein